MDSDFPPDRRPESAAAPDTKTFDTPEETAAHDHLDQGAASALAQDPDAEDIGTGKPHRIHQFRLHWPPSKKEISLIVIIVLLLGGGAVAVVQHFKHPAVVTLVQAAPPPKPHSDTVPSTLTGLPVAPSVNQRTVTGVMIENSPAARPQAGLSQAGVVFEALAEGGVTRFLALYQDTAPANIGPIRSARPYYEQWLLGFDAAYAHVGGSVAGLADVKTWDIQDMNQFYNANYYHRVSSRAAPHNVYTSIADLNQLEAAKGYHSAFTGFSRKAAAPSKKPTATSINLRLSGAAYNVHYDYNAGTNSYNRSEGGAPHIDANTNTQISPTVVIAMVVPESNGSRDSSGAYYSDYNVLGSGPVYVFQDGLVTTGTWTKSSNTSQITFTDASGQPITLDPGQTWITAITSPQKVSYSL